MKNELNTLVNRYQNLHIKSEEILERMRQDDETKTNAYKTQLAINAIWKIVIKDTRDLYDQFFNDHKPEKHKIK